jgi:hypothetical protein
MRVFAPLPPLPAHVAWPALGQPWADTRLCYCHSQADHSVVAQRFLALVPRKRSAGGFLSLLASVAMGTFLVR